MQYIFMLYTQFCKSIDIPVDVLDLNNIPNEFILWIKNNQKILSMYTKYLNYLNEDFNSLEKIEVGKGCYDSIVSDNLSFVTPYDYNKEIIGNDLKIIEHTPFIKSKKEIIIPKTDVFLTHNPYNYESIINWHQIHNFTNYKINIGTYGSIYDSNKEEKIKFIEQLATMLDDNYDYNYDEMNGKYFCNVSSYSKEKKLIKQRRI